MQINFLEVVNISQTDSMMNGYIVLECEGKSLRVMVRVPSGVNIENEHGIEVIIDSDSKCLKDLNFEEFSNECEKFYRSRVGKAACGGIRVEGTGNVLENNIVINNYITNVPLNNKDDFLGW